MQFPSFSQAVNASDRDTFDINKASFRLPLPHPKAKYTHAISFIHLVIPKDWTLDFVNAPMFCYEGKYALPKGFTLEGSISSLFISNRVNLGPFWNYKKDRYSVGIGYQFAFSYGVLNQFGFKTKLTIWEQQPSITLGYSFAKTALVLRGDLIWTTALDQFQGGHKLSSDGTMINGYGMSANFEQRLWKNKLLFFGFKMNNIRYHIVAWPALPVNQYRYWVPETQIGIVF